MRLCVRLCVYACVCVCLCVCICVRACESASARAPELRLGFVRAWSAAFWSTAPLLHTSPLQVWRGPGRLHHLSRVSTECDTRSDRAGPGLQCSATCASTLICHIYIHTHIHTYIPSLSLFLPVCVCVCVCVCVFVCVCLCVCVCTCLHLLARFSLYSTPCT